MVIQMSGSTCSIFRLTIGRTITYHATKREVIVAVFNAKQLSPDVGYSIQVIKNIPLDTNEFNMWLYAFQKRSKT